MYPPYLPPHNPDRVPSHEVKSLQIILAFHAVLEVYVTVFKVISHLK